MKCYPLLALGAMVALSGCLVPPNLLAAPKLPTVEQVCALPPETRAPLIDLMHSTPADMALACALLSK